MLNWLKKIFGTAQSRKIKRYLRLVDKINAEEMKLRDLNDQQLKSKTKEFQDRFSHGESLDDLLIEAFAVVKNCCRRLCGKEIHVSGYNQRWDMVPYDVQILGGIAMHYRSIAEMQTGEGKTLTASMPLYLRALTQKPVHLVTVNDYLAKRDCEWIGQIFRFLGLTVSSLTGEVEPHERKEVYEADIVYGTASEFGFDYLRDNSMAQEKQEQSQRGHYFAIIDEVDSVLIDESRTPLIISGPSGESSHLYDELKSPVEKLVKKQRDESNRLAASAQKAMTALKVMQTDKTMPKLSKSDAQKLDAVMRDVWLISKATPKHKLVKRVRENPDLRAKLEQIETYFYAEPNREEKAELLAMQLMIIDERSQDFELTDRGIQLWDSLEHTTSAEDFVLLDLGHEYNLIDQDASLSDDEKIQKKSEIRDRDSLVKRKAHNVQQLLRAHLMMEKDVDYIIQDDKIIIIDENTGRPQPGRRFSDGLHQAIEAKESVSIQGETQTYATITLQNYFRMYDALAGMTGTASTEASEFKEIYDLDVLEIPTNKACLRKDANDEIYMTEREKYNGLLQEIQKVHADGRPILIGTESVEVSEVFSRILKRNQLKHTVLNAKQHDSEAEIIAAAGQKGAITIATNMAGRGTDIKLGEGVAELGGLHVIGSTRHQSRRIDRQLRGRCARQGDPGTSKFFVSFEDSLMRMFASPRITSMLQRFRPPEGESISSPLLNRSIETAQKRNEQRNYSMRKHTLEYDDVMNKQRQEVYAFRNSLLHTEELFNLAYDTIEDLIDHQVSHIYGEEVPSDELNEKMIHWVASHFPINLTLKEHFGNAVMTADDVYNMVVKKVIQLLKLKLDSQAKLIAAVQEVSGKEKEPLDVLSGIMRNLLTRCMDEHWQKHLLKIDHLRNDVSLRVIGQKDPLMEFKHEAFALFDRFSVDLRVEIAHALFRFEMVLPDSKELHESLKKVTIPKEPTYIDYEEDEVIIPKALVK